ncbi:hypothetical protein DYB28_012955, partial [Aphanomyces astaci]
MNSAQNLDSEFLVKTPCRFRGFRNPETPRQAAEVMEVDTNNDVLVGALVKREIAKSTAALRKEVNQLRSALNFQAGRKTKGATGTPKTKENASSESGAGTSSEEHLRGSTQEAKTKEHDVSNSFSREELDEILGDFGHALDVDLLDASAVDTTMNFVNAMADDLPPQVFKGPMFQEEYNFSKVPVLSETYRRRHKPINPEIEYLRLKNSYPKFLPALKFEDVWQSLCEFEDERMSQSDVRPPSADKSDDDEEFMAKKAEVNKIMNKLEQRFVPLSEIHELPPAQSYSQAQASSAVRPVKEFEVQKHMKHLRQYGFVAPGA